MLIKNISDQKTPKVIGIGPYWIEPGQERLIPDNILYVDETDDLGNKTGRKIILPSIAVQKRMGMINYREETPAPKQEPQSYDGAHAGNGGDGETGEEKAKPATTGRKGKKAE